VCGLPAALGIREGGACVGVFARVSPRPFCDAPVRPSAPGQLSARGRGAGPGSSPGSTRGGVGFGVRRTSAGSGSHSPLRSAGSDIPAAGGVLGPAAGKRRSRTPNPNRANKEACCPSRPPVLGSVVAWPGSAGRPGGLSRRAGAGCSRWARRVGRLACGGGWRSAVGLACRCVGSRGLAVGGRPGVAVRVAGWFGVCGGRGGVGGCGACGRRVRGRRGERLSGCVGYGRA